MLKIGKLYEVAGSSYGLYDIDNGEVDINLSKNDIFLVIAKNGFHIPTYYVENNLTPAVFHVYQILFNNQKFNIHILTDHSCLESYLREFN
jgi:hypothetical protein